MTDHARLTCCSLVLVVTGTPCHLGIDKTNPVYSL